MSLTHISDQDFEKEVLQDNGIVLVDFWAEWCGPCRMLEPVMENIANEKKDVKICKVNVDENREYAEKYNVMSIPNIILFKDGQAVENFVGLQDIDTYIEAIEKHS
jgi:thioredoxin 1